MTAGPDDNRPHCATLRLKPKGDYRTDVVSCQSHFCHSPGNRFRSASQPSGLHPFGSGTEYHYPEDDENKRDPEAAGLALAINFFLWMFILHLAGFLP